MTREEALLLQEITRSNAGKMYIKGLQKEFDALIDRILNSPAEEWAALIGEARHVRTQLKKFQMAANFKQD